MMMDTALNQDLDTMQAFNSQAWDAYRAHCTECVLNCHSAHLVASSKQCLGLETQC